MFERFTDHARRVLVLAQEEARLLGHNFIGTEHILLGLLHDDREVAATALRSLGITLEAVREGVLETVGPAGSASSGSPPFTARAKKVLELSLREALQLGHNYIGTEHLLLGLIREGEGVATQVLVQLGADLARVRQRVIQLIPGAGEVSVAAAGQPTPFGPGPHVAFRRAPVVERTPAATRIESAAPGLAGGLPVASQHLLLAMFDQPDSVAAKALAALGVDRRAVEQQISQIDVAGTGDDMPQVAGGRRVEVRVVEGRVVVEIDDGDLADLIARGIGDQATSLRGDDPAAASFAAIWSALRAAGADLVRRQSLPPIIDR
jgi:ATP-dependent Clp protease ATP-binding subunit ClpA